jgi:hypothetical protein
MFYSIWLLAAALAGWAGGKIAVDDGFGTPPLHRRRMRTRDLKDSMN